MFYQEDFPLSWRPWKWNLFPVGHFFFPDADFITFSVCIESNICCNLAWKFDIEAKAKLSTAVDSSRHHRKHRKSWNYWICGQFWTRKLKFFLLGYLKNIIYIPLEIKCIREYPSVGGNVIKPMLYFIFNVIAYALVLSLTFSLQENISCRRVNQSERNQA